MTLQSWLKLVAAVGAAACGVLAAGGTHIAAAAAALVALGAFFDTSAGRQAVTNEAATGKQGLQVAPAEPAEVTP